MPTLALFGLPLLLRGTLLLAAPPPMGAPSLDPRDDRIQRKAIRGGPVDMAIESQELRQVREFEEEAFPRSRVPGAAEGAPGARPGKEGPDAVPGGPAPRQEVGPDSTPADLRSPEKRRPEGAQLHPSIPWLASLRLLDNLGLGPTFVRFENHVIKYLEFYKEEKRGRAIMASWLRRQGRYRALIEEVLDRHQLPHFLLYVAMIESGYDPHDRSTAGAVGLWQFLPEGARIYGLRVDYWVDERRDPFRSTEAAARYLGDLKARFGSWHLALAAFNAGYGAVLRAMQKYNTNDYWEICRHEDGLPWETLLYVPKAIATALVGENRSLFGYDELVPDAPMEFDRVEVRSSVNLRAAARAAGVGPEEVEKLNPELQRGRTPPLPEGTSWALRLPKGSGARFYENYNPRKEHLESYIVRFGERLPDIARDRNVSVSELRRINGVEDDSQVRPGVTLLLPPAASGTPAPLTPNEEIVVVAVPDKDFQMPGRKRVFYRTIPGDTVSAIARFFKVTQDELARWNNLDLEATLATRMVLTVWVPKDFDSSAVALVDPARVRVVATGSEEFFDLVEAIRGRKRISYVCRPGDTMLKIGKKFGLTVADLERINRIGRNAELRPGQKLIAYVAMSEKERAEARSKLLRDAAQGREEATPAKQAREEGGDEEKGSDAAGPEKRVQSSALPPPPPVPADE